MNLPPLFLDKMRALLGEQSQAFISCLDSGPYAGLRANTLKIPPEALKHLLKYLLTADARRVPWCDEGFYCPADVKPSKSPYFHAGLYYIQEPSAMCPAAVLGALPGQRVLDLCAAPGGKSTALGAALKGEGLLVANDVSASRARALLKNIEAFGIRNAVVVSETPERLAARFNGYFDGILADAPCSGEGMFRKDPDVIRAWRGDRSAFYANIQRDILFHAAAMLAPGGRLVYSTCTFSPDENEIMIQEFLDNHPDFSILPIDAGKLGVSAAQPDFAGGDRRLSNAARIWPHLHNGEGHFIALLKKDCKKTGHETDSPRRAPGVSKKAVPGLDYFSEFCHNTFNGSAAGIFDGFYELRGQSLTLPPPGAPDLSGLRALRSGLYLGDARAGRFEPSQALAMSLKAADVKNPADFDIDDKEVSMYLRGESFACGHPNGWRLVCVGGFPLGWGKVSNGRLKNKLRRGWTAP